MNYMTDTQEWGIVGDDYAKDSSRCKDLLDLILAKRYKKRPNEANAITCYLLADRTGSR